MLEPTDRHLLFDGAVEALVYGKPTDLEPSNLMQISEEIEVETILKPETHTFNARVCDSSDLTKIGYRNSVTILGNYPADGVVIPIGQAACLRTADCLTIIARHNNTGEVIAAHAGRASLIDETRLKERRIRNAAQYRKGDLPKIASG